MKKYRTIRKSSFSKAQEEDLEYSLSLTPEERIARLEKLREINLGKAANRGISKKIVLIK